MAKLTFRRVVHVLHRYYAVAGLPVLGGVLFLFGSLFFLPEAASHRSHVIGATCFIAGSVCYLVAPLMDFVELQINLSNLVDQIPQPSSGDDSQFEILYKSQLLQMQRATALLFCVAGVCFLAGSCLFYPSRHSTTWYTHGDWLYITGCLLSGMGSIFALLTAVELGKTAKTGLWSSWSAPPSLSPPGGEDGEQAHQMPSLLRRVCWLTLSDEEATVLSCVLYLVGNTLFVCGTLLFFPDILRRAREFEVGWDVPLENGAVFFFASGSVVFTLGAGVDLGVVVRSGRREHARSDGDNSSLWWHCSSHKKGVGEDVGEASKLVRP